ncbi:MAG TPA: hypothetical protein PLF91_07160 [Mycolicibacterium fallax]|nr:hypothetical protein [Mycolicibacterium fallax]
MTAWAKRITGLVLILAAVLALVVSAAGLAALWRYEPALVRELSDGAALIDRSAATTAELLGVIDGLLVNGTPIGGAEALEGFLSGGLR